MTDDWSLEDKLIGITGQKRTSKGINPTTDLNEYWYEADDIKTLRQKLIEIIEGGSWWWVGECYEINQSFEDARDYLINQINKQFGVKK